jgi:AraC-like DNA-binding protein
LRIFLRTERRFILAGAPFSAEPCGSVRPSGWLSRYLAVIRWGRDRFPRPVAETILPDGAVHLIFELGSRTRALVAGAKAHAAEIRLAGTVEHVGLQLCPGGVAAVLGVPARAVAGQDVPLSDLWGGEAEAALETLAIGGVPALTAWLAARLRRADAGAELGAMRAVETVRRGVDRVRPLAEALGVGERRVEQLFAAEIGLPPKTFARIMRLGRAVDLAHGDAGRSWASIAAAAGYCDQSHLTRDFRAFTGMTPGRLADFGFFQARAVDARYDSVP